MKKLILITLLAIQINFAQNTLPVGSFQITNDGIYNSTINSGGVTRIYMGYDGANGYIKFGAYTGGGQRDDILYMRGSDGNVGIGTLNPTSKLDVRGTIKSFDYSPLGSALGSSLLINEVGARAGSPNDASNIYKRLWLYRDSESSANWWTTRFHDGISVDGVHNIPQVDTRTWWERDPLDNIQSWGNAAETYLTINKGNVGVGTISPDSKLAVNGTIHSKEVKVDMIGWPDYVFKKEYNLPTLEEVEKHITEKGHLENIPSEKEVLINGINLGEMNIKLLQKIEELTLYAIEQQKNTEKLTKIIEELTARLQVLETK
jgi:hypothetical protein